MIWFVTMLGAVFGLYAKGNQWANKEKSPDPVLTAVGGVSAQLTELSQRMRSVEGRVSALEDDRGRADI